MESLTKAVENTNLKETTRDESPQPCLQQAVQDPNDLSKRRLWNDYSAYKSISIESGREQIRLMQILPAEDDDEELTCAVFDVPPNWNEIVYIALSYYWGDLGRQRKINLIHQYELYDGESAVVNSQEGEPSSDNVTLLTTNVSEGKSFNVTESLFQALHSIRKAIPRIKEDFPILDHQPLWVDATCINQGDIRERNSQVSMMGKIYSKSWFVWIWLGESKETMQGLNLISAMRNLAVQQWGSSFNILNPSEDQMHVIQRSVYKLDDELLGPESCFQILERLFQHPWFRRIWVLQEATIRAESTVIHVTSASVPWAWIIMADRFRHSWRKTLPSGQTSSLPVIWAPLVGARLRYAESEQYEHPRFASPSKHTSYGSLYDLFINTYEEFEATDLRDKLYALLDLATETTGERKFGTELAPDYNKTVSQVFRDFSRWCLERGKLQILSLLCSGPRRILPGNPLHVVEDGSLPDGCLDARYHPSWALWPAKGGSWTVSSLTRAQNHRLSKDFNLASKHKMLLFDLASHPVWKVPLEIGDRLVTLGGKRISKVKSVFREPLRCFATKEPGIVSQKWSSEKLREDVEKHQKHSYQLVSTHPYRANAQMQGGLAPLWYYMKKAKVDIAVASEGDNFEMLDSTPSEWLGKEGGRYNGHDEHMFRDFIETLLLSPVYRGRENFSQAGDADVLDGPWNDPTIAMSLALFWAENDPQMTYPPPRIGKYFREIMFKRSIARDQMFPFLFLAHGKCLFITEDERMGLCSPDVEAGDVVVALFGADVPFVLRPMAGHADLEGESWTFQGDKGFKDQLFRFMGECYLHERMTSSFFDDKSADLGQLEAFSIC